MGSSIPSLIVTSLQTYEIVDTATYLLSFSTDTTDSSVRYVSVSTLSNGKTVYTPLVTASSKVTGFLPAPTPTPATSTAPTTSTSSSTSASSSSLPSSPTPVSTTLTGPATSASSTISGSNAASTGSVKTSKNHSSDTGAIVGAAVGCFILGVLVAALITWLFMSRRQKKHRSSGGGFASQRHESRGNTEKALPAVSVAAVGGVAGNWEKHLDQPEGDNTITRSVKGLFDHIEVHVENFYRDANVNVTPELQAQLMSVDSHHLPDSVAGLLPKTERPTMLIKHCIAQSIVEHISAESEIQDSFLPIDFIALPQALTARRTTAEKPAYNQAYSRWRVLSAYLRPKPAEDATYLTRRDAHIAASADLLCRTFEPWAMTRDNFQARRDNLVNIMKAAAETGMLLFSQPSSFKWHWSTPGSKSGRVRVVLLPGLEKVRDENANEVRPVELLRAVTGVVVG